MAKSRASGAGGGAKSSLEKEFKSKVGNRLVSTFDNGTQITFEYMGKGKMMDEDFNVYSLKDIPGGLEGMKSRGGGVVEILPPKIKKEKNVEMVSKDAARASRLYRKSKAPGARHFSL